MEHGMEVLYMKIINTPRVLRVSAQLEQAVANTWSNPSLLKASEDKVQDSTNCCGHTCHFMFIILCRSVFEFMCRTIRTYEGVEIQIHVFPILALILESGLLYATIFIRWVGSWMVESGRCGKKGCSHLWESRLKVTRAAFLDAFTSSCEKGLLD
jgi:hypothetical protein